MPASSSSLIEPCHRPPGHAAEDTSEGPGLLAALARVADPRRRRGVRHGLAVVLGLAVCAVLTGRGRSPRSRNGPLTLIRKPWPGWRAGTVAVRVHYPPGYCSGWTLTPSIDLAGQGGRAHQAGAGAAAGHRGGRQDLTRLRPRRPRTAITCSPRWIMPRRGPGPGEVGAKTNEIPMFSTLLDRIAVGGRSSPQMRCTPSAATPPTWPGGMRHYLFHRQAQPAQPARPASRPCRGARYPWPATPGNGSWPGRAPHPQNHRVAAGLAFPHAAQAIQIVRRRRLGRKKKWSAETCYAVTSLTVTQASPAELAAISGATGAIEDRLHWVRDMDSTRTAPKSAQPAAPA